MFQSLEQIILSFVNTLPLEVFAFVASFLEEVIAPIPSSAVLLTIGSFASLQDLTVWSLFPLLLISTLGKTIGAVFIYYLATKIGDVIVIKYGKFFGITPDTLEKFRARIDNSTNKYLLLSTLRAIPIFPSAVLSIGCGILKIKLKTFIITTIIGTLVRDAIFIYIGFKGTTLLQTLATRSANFETLIQGIIVFTLIATLGYLYYRKTQTKA